MPIERINPGRRLSQAVRRDDTLYIAGTVADDTTGDVKAQTHQILAKIDALLARVGADKAHLLSATVWLADVTTYDDMNLIWDAWVAPGEAPARACVEAKLAGPQYKVEIAAIAALDRG